MGFNGGMEKEKSDPDPRRAVLDIVRPETTYSLPFSVELLDHIDRVREIDRRIDTLVEDTLDLNRSERVVLQTVHAGYTIIDDLSEELGLVAEATNAIGASLQGKELAVVVDDEVRLTNWGAAVADQSLALRYRSVTEASAHLNQSQAEAVSEVLERARYVRNAPQLPPA